MEHSVIPSHFCLSDRFTVLPTNITTSIFFIKLTYFYWFVINFFSIEKMKLGFSCHGMETFRNNSNVPPPPVNGWPDFSNFQPSEFSSSTYIFSRGLKWWKMMSSLTRLVMIGSRDHESITWGLLRLDILIFTSRFC